jgi:deazaflavin-dependent oxidoreductase (nitroreductase family)
MAKTYQITPFVKTSNAIVTVLLRAGLKMGPMILLTVPGRKSGEPRTTPVALIEQDGKRLLIGSFGDVNWVRNLRAAGHGILTRGRRKEAISVRELSPQEAAPILKRTLNMEGGANFAKPYYDVTSESSLEEIEREAPRHPVFLIQPVAKSNSTAA